MYFVPISEFLYVHCRPFNDPLFVGEMVASLMLLVAQFTRDLGSKDFALRSSAVLALEHTLSAIRHVVMSEQLSEGKRGFEWSCVARISLKSEYVALRSRCRFSSVCDG